MFVDIMVYIWEAKREVFRRLSAPVDSSDSQVTVVSQCQSHERCSLGELGDGNGNGS